jgi:transglutaminase-like putative cysteine protease
VKDQWRATLASVAAVTLTSFSLAPTLAGGPWFKASLFMILLVAAVGMALRAASLPGLLVVATQGLAVVIALIWMFGLGAPDGPNTLTSVWHELSALANEGWAVVQHEAAPITATEGVRLLVVSGVALIALVVDALAVTGRRATLAGIPLLFLYLVPATVLPDGVPWPLFLAAGIGWIVLLLADGWQQLSRWGRPLRESDTRMHSIGGTGRRLGATALAVAVIVPVILPSLDDGRFGGNDTGAGGPSVGQGVGVDAIAKVNPIVDIRRNLQQASDDVVFRYTTDASTPSYFRIATLDRFNGEQWLATNNITHPEQPASEDLPTPPGLSPGIAVSTTSYAIDVLNLDSPRLPLPYPVQSIDVDGDWQVDTETFDVFSHVDSSQGANYRVSALNVDPRADQLRAAASPNDDLAFYETVDTPTQKILRPTAQRVTAKASTEYDQALALQNWFRTKFDYSLAQKAGNGDAALQSFLNDRSGYCEQFAATMALMARSLGIPSRVQVGFTPGTPDGNQWVVTLHDAHAWPELWFEGVGWVRFEPTPGGGDGGATPAWAPPTTSKPDSGKSIPKPILRKGPHQPSNRQLPNAVNHGSRGALEQETQPASESNATGWWLLAIALGAVLVALSPMAAARFGRRRRWSQVNGSAAAVRAAWDDVLDAAMDVELAPAPTETPRDLAARLPRSGGLNTECAGQLRSLALWTERIRYASGTTALPDAGELRQMSEQIRHGLFAALSAHDRRLAHWWPRSGRLALARVWTALSDRVGDVSTSLGGRVSRLLSGRRRGDVPNALRSGS